MKRALAHRQQDQYQSTSLGPDEGTAGQIAPNHSSPSPHDDSDEQTGPTTRLSQLFERGPPTPTTAAAPAATVLVPADQRHRPLGLACGPPAAAELAQRCRITTRHPGKWVPDGPRPQAKPGATLTVSHSPRTLVVGIWLRRYLTLMAQLS
jgi:hypothetical protein